VNASSVKRGRKAWNRTDSPVLGHIYANDPIDERTGNGKKGKKSKKDIKSFAVFAPLALFATHSFHYRAVCFEHVS
jgi:hypothetical protein